MYSAIEKYDDRDYVEKVWKTESKTAKCFSNIIYNQKLVDNYSCTGQAASWVISDATGLKQAVIDKIAMNGTILPLSFRREVWENQLKTWAVEGFGDSVLNWIKQAVKLFNSNTPELNYYLEYFRIANIKDFNMLVNALSHSSVITGFKGSLYKDSQDNGIIDVDDNAGNNGHCIRIVKVWLNDEDETMIKYCDNYAGVNKMNVITVNLTKNKDFFSGGYYLKKVNKK